jgi:MoaA/NifB/PqqE/SkfB family radical SAM enzyme/SAM-dependent methyltransferase
MKALIKVGYACNNHCTFCHTLDVREIDDSTLGVHQKIERAAQLGYTMAVLSGGEPTMRPELVRWAQHSHKRGLKFGLVTNGRMLSYPDLVDRLQDLGLEYVYMSLHGGTAKIHNSMVRAQAFETTFGAVETLSGRGLDLTVNCVVTARNKDHLIPLVDLLLPFDDVCLKFSMVQPKGAADKLFTAVIPRVSEVAERVNEAIRYGQSKSTGLRFAHDGIPLCLVPGFEDLYDDLKTHGFASMTEVYEPDFYPVDGGDSSQTERCADCALRGPCVGLFNKYREAFGDEELRPVPGTRSNSYNYVLERTLPWPDGAPCPIVDSILPYDRGRHIFVRSNGEMLQYRTKTRDFSDPELWHIKFDHGQVYLDVSDKPAPDDFSRDLRKLRELPTCAACVHHGACARAYEIVDEDLFGRDDEAVRAIVADLRGDVLDVGCGETRYADVLGEPAESGTLRYVGVEPSPEHAERARKSRPWARVENTTIERFPLEDRTYDHVLVLRSYNHFRDPGAVLTRLARALRPGGSIVIVDNVAFGLVRTAEQTERAESSTSEFEHYNNHDSFEAQQHVPDDLLALEDHQPVTAAGSNQWVLRYTRRA